MLIGFHVFSKFVQLQVPDCYIYSTHTTYIRAKYHSPQCNIYNQQDVMLSKITKSVYTLSFVMDKNHCANWHTSGKSVHSYLWPHGTFSLLLYLWLKCTNISLPVCLILCVLVCCGVFFFNFEKIQFNSILYSGQTSWSLIRSFCSIWDITVTPVSSKCCGKDKR